MWRSPVRDQPQPPYTFYPDENGRRGRAAADPHTYARIYATPLTADGQAVPCLVCTQCASQESFEMTNAPLDIQPALCPLNVLVRAGRLTKFKGQVASIAPGLSVVATAVLLAGGADQAAAQALNACGPDEVGQDTVTCDARNYAEGITYTESDGLTLILPDATNFGARGDGVNVTGTGEGNVSVRMRNGTVNTSDASVKAL